MGAHTALEGITMLIDLTDDDMTTIRNALLSYSVMWQGKADKGTEGRAAMTYLADRCMAIRDKIDGVHLPVPAVVSSPAPAPAPVALKPQAPPIGGLKVRSEPPKPALPPSPVFATYFPNDAKNDGIAKASGGNDDIDF
jgi:hypothetical protein